MLVVMLGVSQRRACVVAGEHRSTQRLQAPEPTDLEQRLRQRLRAISKRIPGGAGARAHAIVCSEGVEVDHKSTRRLWHEESRKRPAKTRKRQRMTPVRVRRCPHQQPQQPDSVPVRGAYHP